MKMLDEVITELKTIYDRYEAEGCFYCSFLRECIGSYCYLADALHYLKEYQETKKHLACLDDAEIRGDDTQVVNNPPLDWETLKQMEGKPVWVEWTKTEESYWCFVGEWFDDDEMRIYHIGRDYADYIHKTVYTPDIVQAYRKERE